MAGAFSRKTSGISWDLTAFRKIKEHRANAVETPLGVTGLLEYAQSAHRHSAFYAIPPRPMAMPLCCCGDACVRTARPSAFYIF